MSTDETKNDNADDDGTWITVPKKKKRYIGVVIEDHPVVKKILEFIEKNIKSIDDAVVRHDEFNEYLGCLPEMELVIYGIYCGVGLFVPAIYKYDENVGLKEDDYLALSRFLGCEY